MAICPFTKEECPEHGKKGGCALWTEFRTSTKNSDVELEGCALKVSVLLQAQSLNNEASLGHGLQEVAAEISSLRLERTKAQTSFLQAFKREKELQDLRKRQKSE